MLPRNHLATLKETTVTMKPVVLKLNIILFQFCQIFLRGVHTRLKILFLGLLIKDQWKFMIFN